MSRPRFSLKILLSLATIVALVTTFNAFTLENRVEASLSNPVTFTILHTNDFHGQLVPEGTNPGAARIAKVVNEIVTDRGADSVLLLDAGDAMQGSLLTNIQKGYPVIPVFNAMGYDAMTIGNHDYDWGQTILADRISAATFPFLSANIVTDGPDGWTPPAGVVPYIIKTVGFTEKAKVAIIGVTSQETAVLNAHLTVGLTFKDPAEAIIHYYNDMAAEADVIVVLSHLGFNDGGYGIGEDVYGDKTLAQKLIVAGMPADLILGGHSHTNLTAATKVGDTTIAQAYYNGRRVGRADVTAMPGGTVSVTWSSLTIDTTVDTDSTINTLVNGFATDPSYLTLINQSVGYTNVPVMRNYNGDSLMGSFICDAVYNDLNSDVETGNDVDLVLNNPGSERADLEYATYPHAISYGDLFSVLPFGNSIVVGEMTGAQILDLLNQSATLFKGAMHTSGAEYAFYSYTDSKPGPQPWAWGAFDVEIRNHSSGIFEPIVLDQTYRVATNEFLAPSGGDGFMAFKYMKNITYWGDMLNAVVHWSSYAYPEASPYNGVLDGRITRDGNNLGGSIKPLTILHHNDAHGNLTKGTYVGYTQLASLIRQQREHNPDRTLLLSAGDNFQGDSMMYFFRTAPLGYSSDGTALSAELTTHPMMAAMNAVGYDAMTLGEHEFNFGSLVTTSILKQAEFPILGANVSDAGSYGLDSIPVAPYTQKTLDGIDVAILGITNHQVPRNELPESIDGLTFSEPLETAQDLADGLGSDNDVLIALTHIGFNSDANAEVDDYSDLLMAETVSGLDVIIGGHSHTNPAYGFADYSYLPALVSGPLNSPVMVHQAYRYNNTLGEVILGLRENSGGYEVISRAGRSHSVVLSAPEDSELVMLLNPYLLLLNDYIDDRIGATTVPLDALAAFTQETNAANLQADAAVAKLNAEGIEVDFFLGGAMSNKKIASTATPSTRVTLKVSDLFSLMPYENSFVVMQMNGPQLKEILERSYRNYYYYKYVPGYGGYAYYATGMLDISIGGEIVYHDAYPASYDPEVNHVLSLKVHGQEVDFEDPETYYSVATVNYLAMGNVNFNDEGVSLWPLAQVTDVTQYYARDAVIDYIKDMDTISPHIENRLRFVTDWTPPEVTIEAPMQDAALQDGVTFIAEATDASGVEEVWFYVRDSSGNVIDSEFEAMPATQNSVTGKWELHFDTLRLPDGYYGIQAKAVDAYTNEGWSELTAISIRNWAAMTMLPSSASYRAGRSMPIKFSLNVVEAADPEMPFVYNEELTIKIYENGNLVTPLQISVFGAKSTDYRIEPNLLYITNFMTLKKPTTYKVEIWRTGTDFMIGSFTFTTTNK
jgi:5'-nucleotidase / UDP-sugar diphosphatase